MNITTEKQQVIDFMKEKSIVRPRELVDLGLPKDYLYRLAKEGVIEHIGRGLYQWPNKDVGEHQSLIEVIQRVPKGVVALISALNFHGLTTQNPHQIWIAIDRKAWRPKIDYPPIRFITMSGDALHQGIEEHSIEGITVNVFCPAKTIADCFKYRNKIGLDVALEALREGWAAKKFTMDEMMKYAHICRVQNVMRPYLESLV